MGGGNLGDDATQDALLQNIKRRWPDAAIFMFSMNPRDTQDRHGVPSYAIRQQRWDRNYEPVSTKVTFKSKVKTTVSSYRFLFRLLRAINLAIRTPRIVFQELRFLVKSFRIIRSFDLLIISGGGQLLDCWGGPWEFPYTIFKWIVLGRLARVKCYFINVGAGPLDHPLSKYFVKRALLLSHYASFRDGKSRSLIRDIGYTRQAHVVADCVYGLDISTIKTAPLRTPHVTNVGLSPMAYCDPLRYWDKNKSVYDRYIQTFALFGSWLIRRQYHLTLFSTDIWFDTQAIEDLRNSLKADADAADSAVINQEPVTRIEELLSQMASMDYIVTCRLHGVIFAHILNIPVLAISHHPKVTTIMNDFGLSEYCVDIHTFNADRLIDRFVSLVDNRDVIKARMHEKVASYRNELMMQFDHLFSRDLAFPTRGVGDSESALSAGASQGSVAFRRGSS